jgi:hypothetical protein
MQNLTIRQTGTSTTCIGVRFSGQSDNNTLSKCTIEFSGLVSGSTAGSAYIAFAYLNSSLTSVNSTSNGINNTISGCTMQTTNSNSPGPTFGWVNMGNNANYTSVASNNTFTGNTIKNFYYMGAYNYYNNGDQYLNNDISRANSSVYNCASTLVGIYNYYNYATSRSPKIEGNSISTIAKGQVQQFVRSL